MWEVGLWGPKHVGSGTFKMLCHPPPPVYSYRLKLTCRARYKYATVHIIMHPGVFVIEK